MRYLLALLIVISCPIARAQWMTIATNGQKVTVNVGTLVRYGNVADDLWVVKPFTSTQAFVVGSGEFPTSPDPKQPSTSFVLQVYQLPIAQSVTVAGQVTAIPTNTAIGSGPSPAAQPGTAAYCNSGKAKTVTYSSTATVATGLISSAGATCN
jgi:hypothetical protein